MQKCPSRMNLLAWTASALLLAPLVLCCVRYLDVPLAAYVKIRLFANVRWSQLTSDLPDLLLLVVACTTLAAWGLYRLRANQGLFDATTGLARLVGWAAPVSYLVKSALKLAFGRVNTRIWLENPDLYGFHWFQRLAGCEGFPSGHMVVMVTLLAALWRFYPGLRYWCLLLGVTLGVALIATDYHFLSDVLAGAWIGALIEAVVFRWLACRPLRSGSTAP